MKKLLLTLFIAISIMTNAISQNTAELDKKAGFMDIKIGNSISSLAEKVKKDEKDQNMYLIQNVSEYKIENHKIDKIIILVSNDGKETIEHFTLMFVDKIDELDRIARDRGASMERRQNALKEAERLTEKGPEFDYYRKLFREAFGEPTSKESGIEKWIGKKIRLMCTNSGGVGLCNFSTVLSEEQIDQIKTEKGKKASSKF
ncbi:hypothetical protein [uncultured Dokdonia sp.]|uniref:hypothetical protein n=1 Tax=uncultured Dokdonia sp. TaxID=575653 RepID=UPI00260D577C|nr:hypothetical protein [uncultured Dokdonia sp.]